jgi:hypothetical protein
MKQVTVRCNGCGKMFEAYRDGLPLLMWGYCQNTGKRERMKTR